MCSLAISCVVAKLANIQNCFEESVRTLLLEPVQKNAKLAGTNMGTQYFQPGYFMCRIEIRKHPNWFRTDYLEYSSLGQLEQS
jgi:hypothetical protein